MFFGIRFYIILLKKKEKTKTEIKILYSKTRKTATTKLFYEKFSFMFLIELLYKHKSCTSWYRSRNLTWNFTLFIFRSIYFVWIFLLLTQSRNFGHEKYKSLKVNIEIIVWYKICEICEKWKFLRELCISARCGNIKLFTWTFRHQTCCWKSENLMTSQIPRIIFKRSTNTYGMLYTFRKCEGNQHILLGRDE